MIFKTRYKRYVKYILVSIVTNNISQVISRNNFIIDLCKVIKQDLK